MACIFLLSCDSAFTFWKDKSIVVAEVEDSRFSLEELKDGLDEDSVSKEELANRIEDWINYEVMYREAIKIGLQKDPVAKRLIKEAEKKILADRLRITVNNAADTVLEDEMLRLYEESKELFRIDSTEFMPFSDVRDQIKKIILSEKQLAKEKKWLGEIKNNYSIDVYPQYLDSL